MADFDLDEQINPNEPVHSAASKGVGSMAGTAAMFMVGHVAGLWAFRRGKGALFSSIAKYSTNSTLKKAAQFATSDRGQGSLTAFLSKAATPISPIADSLFKMSVNKASQNFVKRTQGMNIVEKFRETKKLGRAERNKVRLGAAARYTREAAVLSPLFYVGEVNMGLRDPEGRGGPSWYNLPGHALNYMKYIPEYMTLDLLGRGAMYGAKAGIQAAGKSLEDALPDGLQKSLVKAASWLQEGRYADIEVGHGVNVGNIIDKAGAYSSAFSRTVVDPTRKKLFTATENTLSKYKSTGTTVNDWFTSIKKTVNTIAKKEYSERIKLRKENQKASRGGPGTGSIDRDFEDYINFMSNPQGKGRTSGYAKVMMRSNKAVTKQAIYKTFYKEGKSEPFLARFLGLRRARGADYIKRKGETSLHKLYDQVEKYTGVRGGKKGTALFDVDGKPISKKDFVERVIAQGDNFVHEASGKSIDIDKLRLGYWGDKFMKKLPNIGGFNIGDITPLKIYTARKAPRAITLEGIMPLHPKYQTSAFKSNLYKLKKDKSQVGTVTYNNVYDFGDRTGLALRTGGGKRYEIYDTVGGEWTQIGKNVKMSLYSNSIKQAKVYHEMMASDVQGLSPLEREYSDNKFVRFLQKDLDLLHTNRDTSGVWNYAKAYMPKSMSKYLFDTTPNTSRDIVKNISRYANNPDFEKRIHNLKPTERNDFIKNVQETLKLGAKVQKRAYDGALISDSFFEETLNFIKVDKKLGINNISKIIESPEELVNLARKIQKSNFKGGFGKAGKDNHRAVKTIINQVDTAGMDAITNRTQKEIPLAKLKKYIHDYAAEASHRGDIRAIGGEKYDDILLKKAEKLFKDGRLSDKQLSDIEFSLFTGNLDASLANKTINKNLSTLSDETSDFLRTLSAGANQSSLGSANIDMLTNFRRQLSYFDTAFDKTFETDHIGRLVSKAADSPWVAYPGNMKEWFVGRPFNNTGSLLGGWINATTRRLINGMGLGWDRTRFDTPTKSLGLWGKRFAAYGAASLGYNALDTFTDTSGMFDWSMLDEGVTVALADQATKLRLSAGAIYDALGVDNVTSYMEGLMPGSSKFIPGAAMGLMMGGVKGAAIGGLAQSYLQPQLAEGPLSFLAVAPPLAPFVTDMTKDFDELQAIYEGTELVPYRKGAGWTLGNTPIEGGRVEQWVPNWYARLKSQYKASPVMYGSKLEQFLAKDLPFLDISPMDLIDPQYLTYKQYEDRPYVVPDTPFAEVPIFGPVLGATAGRVWNFLHPLGRTSPMHQGDATDNFFAGQTYDWKGNPTGSYGPQYAGAKMFDIDTGGFAMPGNNPNELSLHSPYHAKPAIAEQIYRGWIEWFGLPGFTTSAMLWGGDEPFNNIPVTPSASEMDSMGRTFWEQNLGDMAMTNELYRRFVPRPRTSYETVDLVRNTMPTWMPSDLQRGDPYCLLPESLVETNKGLVRADRTEAGMLLKTLQGRYMPVEAVLTRPVKEEIYKITLKGLEDFPIKVTGGHPFYIDNDWVFAEDLNLNDLVSYPDLDINIEDSFSGKELNMLGLLARWYTVKKNKIELRPEAPLEIKSECLYNINYLIEYDKSLVKIIKDLQSKGIDHVSTLVNLCNYITHFRTAGNGDSISFKFHSVDAAYKTWTQLLSFKIFATIKNTELIIEKGSASKLQFFLDNSEDEINVKKMDESILHKSGEYTTKHSNLTLIPIVNIEKEFYDGLVYTIDVDEDSTYCVPGAVVHNSKIAFGELLMPGAAYEDYFNPDLSFPVGMSRLGYDAYEQALGMIGITDFSKEAEEIMEEGTAIHKMVQNQLMASGQAIGVEALISDPQENIRSYVDVMLANPQGGRMPLEVKSISDEGLAQLERPKWSHKVQLNAYMAVMGANTGKFLYVSRENPAMTKNFTVRFDPELWEDTKATLGEARDMAKQFIAEGYGKASHGYSYLDRMRVLLNAAPFSPEFRETERLVGQADSEGLLNIEERETFSKLKQHHTAMMRKYEMYPRRFQYDQILNPDEEYTNLSLNDNIKPASDYNIAERLVGSAWEYFTHMRSPIHTKLIGHYSPQEQYERKVLYGTAFQSWATPIDSFVEPYGRGLMSVEDPGQGVLSWGTGGALLGGLPGAVAGGILGGAYGTAHGMYRAVFGGKYTPDSFKEKTELATYFDNIEYERNMNMYQSTGDDWYRQEAFKTVRGAVTHGTGFGDFSDMGAPGMYMTATPKTERVTSIFNEAGRRSNNAFARGVGLDMGFGSPWQGMGDNYDLDFHSVMSSLPAWDKPFFSAMAMTPEEQRDDILETVDSQMGMLLKKVWGRGEEFNMPEMDTYWNQYHKPTSLNPIMDPTQNFEDIQTVTVMNSGLDNHDFGLGWREQMRKINNSASAIVPVDINAKSTQMPTPTDISSGELESTIRALLDRSGYEGAVVNVSSSYGMSDSCDIVVEVKRTSHAAMIKTNYKNIL